MKNRTVIGIICVALALVLCFVVSPIVSRMAEGSIKVVKITKEIERMGEIKGDSFESASVSKSQFSADDYFEYDEFVELTEQEVQFAEYDLYVGEFLMRKKVSGFASNAGSVLESMPAGKVAMSITISSFAAGLSGKLQNGDIVSVVAYSNEMGGMIPEALTYVKVITTTTDTGTDKDQLEANEDGTYDLPSTVTLQLSEEQAASIIKYEEQGTIYLALQYRGNSSIAQSYLDEQDRILGLLPDETAASGEQTMESSSEPTSETQTETTQAATTKAQEQTEAVSGDE